MIIRKKQLVSIALVLTLSAAVFVNWYFSRPGVESVIDTGKTTENRQAENLGDAQYVSATAAASEAMASFKVKREAAHDEAKEALESVIKDAKSDSEAAKKAADALTELSQGIKREADLENLITAKISSENVVIIDGDVCQVIVNNGVLTDNVSLQIKDLVIKQADIPAQNITIVELKK